jgi:hypothetical protein
MATPAPQPGGLLPRSTRLLLIEDIQSKYIKAVDAIKGAASPEAIQNCQIALWKALRVEFKDLEK